MNKECWCESWKKVRFVMSPDVFWKMNKEDIPFAKLETTLDKWIDLRNKFQHSNIGHGSQYLFYEDKFFTFSVYEYEFCLWDEWGSTSLLNCKIDGKSPPTKEFVTQLFERLDDYINNICCCSGCAVKLKKDEIAGRYYAGIYCKDCWDSKWRDIEAADDYE